MKGDLIVVFVLMLCGAYSQSPVMHNYSVEHGLPSSETYDIIQDSKGYIWIATDRGVCRFDGYKFRTFSTEHGLTDNTVFKLHEDDKGRIWFMAFNGKLCYYENDTIKLYQFNSVLAKLPPLKLINSFACRNDSVKIGYIHQGHAIISPNGKLTRKIWPDTLIFRASIIGSDLIMSTDGPKVPSTKTVPFPDCVFRFETGTATVSITYKKFNGSAGIRGIRRRNGSYVFYCPGKLIEISPDKKYYVTEQDQRDVYCLYEDRDSCLWLSLKDNGVFRYGPNASVSSKAYSNYLSGMSVSAIRQDNEGSFWLSTLSSGIYYIPSLDVLMMDQERNKKTVKITQGEKSQYIIQFKDGKWNLLTINDNIVSHTMLNTPNSSAYCSVYKNNCFWLGGNNGIEKICNGKAEFYNLPAIRNISFSADNNYAWIISTYELIKTKADNPSKPLTTYFLPSRADALLIDSKQQIWVGTQNGLYRFDESSGKFIKPYSDTTAQARITEIKELKDGTLVLSTIGKGILMIGKSGVHQISSANGLTGNIVNGIDINNNTIWAATNLGLSSIQFIDGDTVIRNYGIHNGLPTIELNKVLAEDDYVWLASGKGTVRVSKQWMYSVSPSPVIYLTKIADHNNNTISAEENGISLNYNYGLIKIDFLGLSFKKMGAVRYKYKLQGLSEEWQYTSVPSVQFTSLDPGNYVFQVAAENENGRWSEKPVTLKIFVKPPFWATWWFISLSIVAGLLLIYLIVFIRLRQQRNKTILLEKMNNLHMQALASQMNPHFIFNSLTSIQAFILKEDNLNASVFLSRFSKLMRMELENIRQQFVTIDREFEMLEHYLKLEQLRFKDMFDYEMNIDVSINKDEFLVPSMLIQPYVENCIKHGLQHLERKGLIRISLLKQGNRLLCSVEDNGVGRKAALKEKYGGNASASTLHQSAGMSVTEQRLKLLCDNLQIEYSLTITDITDDKGDAAGTRVEFVLPHKAK